MIIEAHQLSPQDEIVWKNHRTDTVREVYTVSFGDTLVFLNEDTLPLCLPFGTKVDVYDECEGDIAAEEAVERYYENRGMSHAEELAQEGLI